MTDTQIQQLVDDIAVKTRELNGLLQQGDLEGVAVRLEFTTSAITGVSASSQAYINAINVESVKQQKIITPAP